MIHTSLRCHLRTLHLLMVSEYVRVILDICLEQWPYLCCVVNGHISVVLLPYSIASGALESPDLLLSSVIILALDITIILIITLISPKT